MSGLAERLLSIVESKVPIGLAPDEDLTAAICPDIGERSLAAIYEDLRSDPLASYREADGYDILSIERRGALVTTELRILRNHQNAECNAVLFNKYP